MKPNDRCKGLLTTGFSSEAVCTRVLRSLASHGSAPLLGLCSGNSQAVWFSVMAVYVLPLSSSSGNWTLMNIPCVVNVCFFRISVCSYFSFFLFFFFFLEDKTPLFERKYCTVHIIAFTSVRIAIVEFSVSDILAFYTSNCFRKKCMLNYALKYILSGTRRGNEDFYRTDSYTIKLLVCECPLSLS